MQNASSKMVVVADRDPAICKAVARMAPQEGFQMVALGSDRELASWLEVQAQQLVAEGQMCCLVLDIQILAELDGRTLTGATRDIPKIYIGQSNSPCDLTKLSRMGFFDFIQKPFTMAQLMDGMRAAFAHYERIIQGARQIAEQKRQLSKREYEVGQHVVKGLTNQEIATLLGISIKTVKAHRAKVMQKTGSQTLVDLVRCYDRLSPTDEGKQTNYNG